MPARALHADGPKGSREAGLPPQKPVREPIVGIVSGNASEQLFLGDVADMEMWAPVARAGEFFTMLFKSPRSHASRITGLSVFPCRRMACSAPKNSYCLTKQPLVLDAGVYLYVLILNGALLPGLFAFPDGVAHSPDKALARRWTPRPSTKHA